MSPTTARRAEYDEWRKRRGLEEEVRREKAHVANARDNLKRHKTHLAAAREALAEFEKEARP